ncbi:probable UDP-N-acetylglucosamine pyrophosphorylase [Zygosaccharomyces bailii]|nr:probable UDP-N-acetylglucosamine pyrophosphorylase [Zygosaccharomyces bailii]
MTVVDIYKAAGQDQLFDHFGTLTENDKKTFINNLEVTLKRITPQELISDCKNAIAQAAETSKNSGAIEALPDTSYQSVIDNPSAQQTYNELGLKAVNEGQVAVILMAGGQGTRLGSSAPKGCYDIGLPSHKSLFQIQAEKLLSLQRMSKTHSPIPWYIMTSKPTHESTEQFFKKHSYFGLQPSQVTFFSQGTLPALDLKGEKLLLSSPTELVESPDGNGGLYRAIKDNDLLKDFKIKGIKHVYMYCVDNVLSKLADPVFIGFAIKHNFELATKAVRKRDAHESVGLIATKNGKPCVIEYSEISPKLAAEKDKTGLLKLRAANIVNHYYSVDLLNRELDNWCDSMPYHIARKKIPIYDNRTGQYTKPTEPNGIKLEQFIFDVFPSVPLNNFGCLEVDRSQEFSPLKNGPGSTNDNPETSRAAYLQLGTSRLSEAGAHVEKDIYVEVSSKLSYAGENLSQYSGQTFSEDGTILE